MLFWKVALFAALMASRRILKVPRRGAKIPPTKGDDLLDCVGHGLEAVKLVLSTANINAEGRGNISKGKMYVRIQCCINVIHIHM